MAWDDSRSATGESKAQDVYFTRVHLNGTSAVKSAAGTSVATKARWAISGLTLGLALSGLVLRGGWERHVPHDHRPAPVLAQR